MSEHTAENDAGRRWGAWTWNLVLDLIDWATLTEGIGFREFRSLGADARLAGRNYFRETLDTPPAERDT